MVELNWIKRIWRDYYHVWNLPFMYMGMCFFKCLLLHYQRWLACCSHYGFAFSVIDLSSCFFYISPISPQESALAHVELPTTVETVEAAIKKHKDFTTTMELNLHRIKAVIEAGESLISQNNIYSERIRERVDLLANR